MKILLVLSILLVVVKGQQNEMDTEDQQRVITEQVVEAIERAKLQMPCGFPNLGIPPLAPFTTPHQNISLAYGRVKAKGEIKDLRINGLNDFDIEKFKVNLLTSKINFSFLWKRIHLNTEYLFDTKINKLSLSRSGSATIAVNDLKVWGTIRYILNLVSGKLRLKELSLYTTVGKVEFNIEGLASNSLLNNKLNALMEEWVTLVVNDNTENIASFTNDLAMPYINKLIADMDMLSILLNISNTEPGEPCIPPEDGNGI